MRRKYGASAQSGAIGAGGIKHMLLALRPARRHKRHHASEVSCGEFETSQHCHVAGHTLPNSSNIIFFAGRLKVSLL
jgi:hypothetical protein